MSKIYRSASVMTLATVVGLAGCTATPGTSQPTASGAHTQNAPTQAAPTPEAPAAELSITPATDASNVTTTTPVVVSVANGTISTVTVTDPDGGSIPGAVNGSQWTSSRFLRPNTSYTVKATASGADGKSVDLTSTFKTKAPRITATYSVLYDGATVGVGAPASIQFDSAVTTKERRAQVEKLVKISVTPAQEGSWGWLDQRQLMWRPKDYWKPGTKVVVEAPIAGVETGDDKVVGKDGKATFTVGPSMVSTVDIAAHSMTVRRDGAVVKVMPVSTGRPGPDTETRSGTKVIISKERKITMDSETLGIKKGDPGYYKIDTDYNLRVTWTGEFLHSAPWSVGAQGNSNVSHGCTNLSPSNAEWMYNNSRVGDIVKFVGSGRNFAPTEGIGVWVYSFDKWAAQSALAGAGASTPSASQ